jgi:hypothetical protein
MGNCAARNETTEEVVERLTNHLEAHPLQDE